MEILKSGSVRGVKLFYKAEYCGTPQSKERRNREYKVCLNNRALRLLDNIIIYDLLITIAYFSVTSVLSVAISQVEKTKPISNRLNLRKILYERRL